MKQMEAGSDTTASTLLAFLLAMIKHPGAFKKAQQEADQVCGTSRSPSSEDMDQLPYLSACMQEVSTLTFYLTARCLTHR
jgi:cytochrome P450